MFGLIIKAWQGRAARQALRGLRTVDVGSLPRKGASFQGDETRIPAPGRGSGSLSSGSPF